MLESCKRVFVGQAWISSCYKDSRRKIRNNFDKRLLTKKKKVLYKIVLYKKSYIKKTKKKIEKEKRIERQKMIKKEEAINKIK